jgi:hypothetical protein
MPMTKRCIYFNLTMIMVFPFAVEYNYKLTEECLSWGDNIHCRELECDFQGRLKSQCHHHGKRIVFSSTSPSDRTQLSPDWARI